MVYWMLCLNILPATFFYLSSTLVLIGFTYLITQFTKRKVIWKLWVLSTKTPIVNNGKNNIPGLDPPSSRSYLDDLLHIPVIAPNLGGLRQAFYVVMIFRNS